MAENLEKGTLLGTEEEGDILMDSTDEQGLLDNNPALKEATRRLGLSMEATSPEAPLGEKTGGDATN